MLSRKTTAIASNITIVCSIATAPLAQETFKSAKFLTYSAEAQHNYIATSVVAATAVVSLNSAAQAKCLGEWITKHKAGNFRPVMEVMKKYPDDHPTGLIVAVLQRDCGSFKYAK
jgi:hypothetical protein